MVYRVPRLPLLTLGALFIACQDGEQSLAPGLNGPQFSLSASAGLNGRIAFHSNRAGTFDIWVMNADGSGATRLTDDAGQEFGPRFSPNGQRIAFSSNRDGDFEIFVINVDGTGLTQLTHTPANFNPTWSPDGRKIAFNSNRDGFFHVWTMNADGSGVTQLTHDFGVGDAPTAWSPDGKQIAFVSNNRSAGGEPEIFVMNADGTGITQLTTSEAEGDAAGWSPDGKRFVFSSTRADGFLHIFVMNADGTGVTPLTAGLFTDDDPVWSPDGKQIAFQSTRDGDEEIFVMNADGSEQTQLTFNEGIFDAVPSWRSPPLHPESSFNETFSINSTEAQFAVKYPRWTVTKYEGNPPLEVTGGMLFLRFGGSNLGLSATIDASGFAGPIEITAELGGGDGVTSAPCGYNTGLVIGDNTIVFHPGCELNGVRGHLRIDGPGGFSNQDVGWVPAENVLHRLVVVSDGTGNFTGTLTDGTNASHTFSFAWTNPGAVGTSIGFKRYGGSEGDGFFSSLTIGSHR